MKHLQNFNDFKPINEEVSVKGVVSELIGIALLPITIPIAILGLTICNFSSPRIAKEVLKRQLDTYSNLDELISLLEKAIFSQDYDLTDQEKHKLVKQNDELKRLKKKFPTIESFKKRMCKICNFLNFRNINYLQRYVNDYKPVKLSEYELISTLKKVSKLLRENRVRRDNWNLSNQYDRDELIANMRASVRDNLNPNRRRR